jgi:tetratricopeptide (TPR) repeat protein
MLIQAEEISDGLSPEHLNICLQRSYTEARIGHMEEALDALERSKDFQDPHTNVDYNLLAGHIYLLFQYRDKALECFSQALSTSQDHIHTMRTIAQVFMDCQDYLTATKILHEIEELIERPEYEESKSDIIKVICPAQAYCYYQTGLRAEFIYYLQMAIVLNPKDTQIFFRDIFPKEARVEDYLYYAEGLL